MIYLNNVSLIWFGRLPSLPPRFVNVYLMVFNDRLTSSMNMDSLEGDYDSLHMESWYLRKTSDILCLIHNFRAAVLFNFFCLLLFSPILIHHSALRYFSSGGLDSQNQIRVLPGGYIIFQSCLILLQYFHRLHLCLLNRDDG